MRRAFRWTGWILLGLFGAVAAALAWALGTEAGLRFALEQAERHSPVAISVDDAEGRLAGPLTLRGLHVDLDAAEISAEAVELDYVLWRLLLRRAVRVERLVLTAPEVRLRDTPPPEEPAPERGPWEPIELPLRIDVQRLRIERGAVFDAEGEPLVSALDVVFAGRAEGTRVHVRELDVTADQGRVTGQATLDTHPRRPLSADLEWEVTLPDLPALAGRTRIDGRIADLTIDQQVSGFVDARVRGQLTGLPHTAAGRLSLDVSPLRDDVALWPEDLHGAAASLEIDGSVERARLTGTVDVPAHVEGPVALELVAGWVAGTLQIDDLLLGLRNDGRLHVRGRLRPDDAMEAEVEIRAERLGWPLGADEPEYRLATLSVDASGADDTYDFTLDARGDAEPLGEVTLATRGRWRAGQLHVDELAARNAEETLDLRAEAEATLRDAPLAYRFALALQARVPELPEVDADIAGAGDAESVAFERLQIAALDGTLDGEGTLGWAGDTALDFSLDFDGLDPGTQFPDWPGRVSGRLHAAGTVGETPDVTLRLSDVSGSLRERTLGGRVTARLVGEQLTIDDSELRLGDARLALAGELGDTLALDFDLDAPSLHDLHPDARGTVRASGRLAGTTEAPDLRARVSAESLHFGDYALEALDADLDVDLGDRRPSRVEVSLRELSTDDTLISTLALSADGRREDHRVTLAVRRDDATLALGVAGALAESLDDWQGELTQLALGLGDDELWALDAPAPLALGASALRLEEACLSGLLGELCIDGGWVDGEDWTGAMTVGALDLESLSTWLGQGLIAEGRFSGRIDVAGGAEGLRDANGQLDLSSGRVYLVEQPDDTLLGWQSGRIGITGDDTVVRADLDIVLTEDEVLTGGVSLGWNDPELPLDGEVSVQMRQLGLVAELLPDLAALEGVLDARFTVEGSAREPLVNGQLSWSDGAAQVPVLGIRPEAINVRVDLDPETIRFEASARSGDGELTSRGSFAMTGGFRGNASVTGSDLLVMNLPEARVLASPRLGLDFRDNTLVVNGLIEVPTARITGILQGTGAVSVSGDEVIVGELAQEEAEQLDVQFNLRLNVGPDVNLEVAGLRGRVEGSLLAIQRSGEVPFGQGEVRVLDGTFGAFGQRLEIDQGRLLFTGGPLEDPGLDIRAVRRIDEIVAGAQVRGTVSEPEISIFSEPPMPRAEALSYLTIGKSINELDSGEQDALNSAANSLALSGGNLLAREIGGRLGFDEVGVAAGSEPGSAALVVGRHFGPRLFVSYGVGLFDAVNELRLRYRLSTRWAVEAASGEQSSADLFYTIER